MCSSWRCDDLFTPVSVPLGLQCFIQIELVHKLDVSGVVFLNYILKLNVFNQFQQAENTAQLSQKRQQLFKHMAVCISVEFQNFDGQKVHLSKIWQKKKNQCPLWTLWTGLFLLLWAINPEHKLIPVSSVTSGDAQEPAVLHWKVWKLTRGRIQDMQRTPLNLIVSFVEIIVKRLWLMPQTLRKYIGKPMFQGISECALSRGDGPCCCHSYSLANTIQRTIPELINMSSLEKSVQEGKYSSFTTFSQLPLAFSHWTEERGKKSRLHQRLNFSQIRSRF